MSDEVREVVEQWLAREIVRPLAPLAYSVPRVFPGSSGGLRSLRTTYHTTGYVTS